MSATDLWQLEERFWTADAAYYREHLAAASLMVLAPPSGVLNRAHAIAAVHTAPRWTQVQFATRRLVRPGEHTAVLAYAVTAQRAEAEAPYRALCSSTYVRQAGQWKLALHQQTPLAA